MEHYCSLLFDRRMHVKGIENLRNMCYQLCAESVSFAIDPLPDDYYDIYYKSDAEPVFGPLKKVWGYKGKL